MLNNLVLLGIKTRVIWAFPSCPIHFIDLCGSICKTNRKNLHIKLFLYEINSILGYSNSLITTRIKQYQYVIYRNCWNMNTLKMNSLRTPGFYLIWIFCVKTFLVLLITFCSSLQDGWDIVALFCRFFVAFVGCNKLPELQGLDQTLSRTWNLE